MEKKRNLDGYPDRHIMVTAAVDMERRGFSWGEFRTVSRLCDSSKAIREYALAYIDDLLDMWDGLVPHNGYFNYEIAFIAAQNAWARGYEKIGKSDARVRSLVLCKEEWTEAEYQAARDRYRRNHPYSRYCKTKRLIESLEMATCETYGEPYEDGAGHKVIPFVTAKARK